jgi:hypothetical protein
MNDHHIPDWTDMLRPKQTSVTTDSSNSEAVAEPSREQEAPDTWWSNLIMQGFDCRVSPQYLAWQERDGMRSRIQALEQEIAEKVELAQLEEACALLAREVDRREAAEARLADLEEEFLRALGIRLDTWKG